MSNPLMYDDENQKFTLNKQQISKIVQQCKQELKDRFIDYKMFTFEVETSESIYGGEMCYLSVMVLYKNDIYYQFNEVYIDDDFNILQYTLSFG